MANGQPNNINDCGVGDTSQPPANKFAFDGVSTNQNVKNGGYVPPAYCHGTLDYSTSPCAEKESNYIAGLMAESLQYAAGPVNVFPLLGIHNQGSTIDQPGDGYPISGGTPSGFNALDAFNVNLAAWRSVQTGAAVTAGAAYIGYDFGTKKAWVATPNPTERYYPTAPVRRQIATVKIKQSTDPLMRSLQARVEASDDGVTWVRVAVINLPNTDQLVVVPVNSNAMYNKWRLVPTFFTGVAANNPWEVVELHLLEETQMTLDMIEDYTLLENRDRAYCRASTMIKCTYDMLDVQSELAKFGITLPQTYIFTCSFADMVRLLGRPVVVGDIVELPGEVQYDANLRAIRKWLEVTDTAWSTEGYTMNWRPNLYRFYAQPIHPSIEHKDILGVPGQVNQQQADSDFILNVLQNDLAQKATESIMQVAADLTPQTGEDPQDIQSAMPLLGPKGGYDGTDMYAEDAIPPNGAPFTSGDTLPDPLGLGDGSYHRQTYTNVPSGIRPPDRLLQWSTTNQRWTVIEINTRVKPESHKKTISRIMGSANKITPDAKI